MNQANIINNNMNFRACNRDEVTVMKLRPWKNPAWNLDCGRPESSEQDSKEGKIDTLLARLM